MTEKTKNGRQGEGGGRPPREFSPAEIDTYEKLAAVLTKKQCADFFQMSETTLREVEKRQPEVADAYKKGKSNAVASVAQSLLSMATRKGNVTAAIFYLKTQAGWKEGADTTSDTETPSFTINVSRREPVGDMRITRGS